MDPGVCGSAGAGDSAGEAELLAPEAEHLRLGLGRELLEPCIWRELLAKHVRLTLHRREVARGQVGNFAELLLELFGALRLGPSVELGLSAEHRPCLLGFERLELQLPSEATHRSRVDR